MVDKTIYQTFKKGSKTFFTSSLFFPTSVREDIFIFYSFVRTADDLVDSIPPQLETFNIFKKNYARALTGTKTNNIIIDSFVELQKKHTIPQEWITAFLHSMTLDTYKKSYATFEELEEYLYGSAEVIGLIMAKLLNLPTESYDTAKYLGKAFQYINFIRDIAEDITLGRCYFPQDILQQFGLSSLNEEATKAHPDNFQAFMTQEIKRYFEWQTQGELGFKFIPKRYLIPIKTASDMYRYTAHTIEKEPFIVYRKKIKPNKPRILINLLINCVALRNL